MPAHITNAARQQGWKNALIAVPSFLIVVWLVERAIILTTETQGRDVWHAAFVATWWFFLLFSLARRMYCLSIAGRILLDCGPLPRRLLWLVGGVFTGLMSCLLSYPVLSIDFWFSVSIAAYFLIASFGRLQLREKGIFQYWGLLQWRKIASYRWAEDATLLVKQKSLLSLQAALCFPPEQKQAVDTMLNELCPIPDPG